MTTQYKPALMKDVKFGWWVAVMKEMFYSVSLLEHTAPKWLLYFSSCLSRSGHRGLFPSAMLAQISLASLLRWSIPGAFLLKSRREVHDTQNSRSAGILEPAFRCMFSDRTGCITFPWRAHTRLHRVWNDRAASRVPCEENPLLTTRGATERRLKRGRGRWRERGEGVLVWVGVDKRGYTGGTYVRSSPCRTATPWFGQQQHHQASVDLEKCNSSTRVWHGWNSKNSQRPARNYWSSVGRALDEGRWSRGNKRSILQPVAGTGHFFNWNNYLLCMHVHGVCALRA